MLIGESFLHRILVVIVCKAHVTFHVCKVTIERHKIEDNFKLRMFILLRSLLVGLAKGLRQQDCAGF